MSQPGSQTITIHILTNISQRKGKQTMKFGQVTSENFFLKHHTQNVVQKLVPDSFLKNQIEDISGLQQPFYAVCFHRMPQLRTIKIY